MTDHQLLLLSISFSVLGMFLVSCVLYQCIRLNQENKKIKPAEKRPLVFIPGIEHIDILEEQVN